MKEFIFFLTITIFFSSKLFASENDCGAFFIKKGVAASFPILKKRDFWEWYKKVRPEYAWTAETGFYRNNEFKGNGFGFVAIIGSADLEKNKTQKGNIDELVRFSAKGAFLTKESKSYSVDEKREKIQFSTIVMAKVLDDESILVGTVDPEAVAIAKTGNPTHMKLTAVLPEEGESYTCYPTIDIVK